MANVNIKFNNKDYLLSCDDGQEESLKKLDQLGLDLLDKKFDLKYFNCMLRASFRHTNF